MASSEAALAVTGDYDFTLFSISADNQVKVHQLEKRGTDSGMYLRNKL